MAYTGEMPVAEGRHFQDVRDYCDKANLPYVYYDYTAGSQNWVRVHSDGSEIALAATNRNNPTGAIVEARPLMVAAGNDIP